jgi:predicted Rossmann fold flavoprotein
LTETARATRVVVVGAGAAGTLAAIFAASNGADTVLLERTKDGGRKIVISGGGRCNILPAAEDDARFVTDSSPHTLRRIVRSWPLREQMAFFEREAGIPLMEEAASAKLFPQSESGRDVRDRLLSLARARGVTILNGVAVSRIVPVDSEWHVFREDGSPFVADAVIVATGGRSVPSTGSDGLGLTLVEALGHAINHTYPALTPLLSMGGSDRDAALFGKLAGISLPVVLKATAGRFNATAQGGFLFTHNGYSGPAVLDVSHVPVRSLQELDAPARITVRWTPLDDNAWEALLRPMGVRTVVNAVAAVLPDRLADALVELSHVDRRRKLSQLTRDERNRLVATLVRGELPWSGDEGYKKAEVTGGGVALSEINPRTMESVRHKGLFLCGEILDAFGPIGGFNFLWAWATGRAAGIGAAGAARG